MEQVLQFYPFIALAVIGLLIVRKIKLSKYARNDAHFNLLYYPKKTVEIRKRKVTQKQNLLTGIIVALLISIMMLQFRNLTPFINFSESTNNQASK
jgi:hypothetical protein